LLLPKVVLIVKRVSILETAICQCLYPHRLVIPAGQLIITTDLNAARILETSYGKTQISGAIA
jgi:hypothetical protein